jgi:hypothetical protein
MARVSGLALLLLGTHAAWAQYVVSARAGTVHYIRGQVSVDGQPVPRTPLQFPMLREGQVLRTGNGRAEVLLGPGVFLRLGEEGALRMLDTRLENTQAEVQQGTALVEVVEIPRGGNIQVVTGPARTSFKGIGLHRFEADSNELRVFGGNAEVSEGDQTVEAGRGRVVHLGDVLSVSRFDPRRDARGKDALHQWAARRSFLLYRSNMQDRSRRTNWEVSVVTPAGNKPGMTSDQDRTFVSNRDFGVTFYLKALRPGYAGSKLFRHGAETPDSDAEPIP